MSRPAFIALFTLSISSLVLTFSACTVVTNDNDNTDSGTSSGGTSGTSGATGDSGTPADAGSGGDADAAVNDQACAAKAANECQACCGANHPAGRTVYDKAFSDCACGDPTDGQCATECAATVCAKPSKDGDETCNACLRVAFDEASGGCATELSEKCNAAPDCDLYVKCADACPE